ncbi:peptidylprolyl isomerase [Rudanella paleaurantiibacter]|uniref:Peptidyl-prolyl cis-trans isomerase n=1 Tax=Rudanella paleaurantiibacter TaxID=2614655 RepID=A0A7J5U2L4_9BACT|nr:FKBP-type peptidyl-prolyl cis-trans isomerase [Rudanella paleaurantiibacter]KAB7731930.1 peptidylprolyl isomerase [Rudanella paleaurantiibacter]
MLFNRLATAALLVAAMAACGRNRVEVSETGLKYQLHEDNEESRKAKVGDIMTIQLQLKNSKDSVLRDTHKEPAPLKLMLQVPPFKGSFEEGLAMLSKGDSATFYVSADSLFGRAMQAMPPGVTKGSDITFNVKVLEVQSEEEYRKAETTAASKQKGVDDKIIADYLAKNGLAGKAQKTEQGVYYVITQPGSGPVPNRGDLIKVDYTGKLLDGKTFDSSVGKQPIELPIGVGQVIPGWDDAMLKLHKGEKATLIIPSTMAYGAQGSPPVIPANAVLVFDVNLIDIRKNTQQP